MSIWPLTLDDLGWPWPLTLTFGVAGHSHKPNGFCLKSIRWIFIEIWPKRSIWPWPWVTLDDLDLWPQFMQVIHTSLMTFVWSQYHQYSLKYDQKVDLTLTLDDLDLWPYPLVVQIIHTSLMAFIQPNGQQGRFDLNLGWPWMTFDLWPWRF